MKAFIPLYCVLMIFVCSRQHWFLIAAAYAAAAARTASNYAKPLTLTPNPKSETPAALVPHRGRQRCGGRPHGLRGRRAEGAPRVVDVSEARSLSFPAL